MKALVDRTRTRAPSMGRRLAMMFLLAVVPATACTYSVHVNHTSDYRLDKPLSAHRVVESEGSQFVIMGLVGQTDYVNKAFEVLQKKCPAGSITGIQTRYSSSHGFLSWTNVIQMKGYCSQ